MGQPTPASPPAPPPALSAQLIKAQRHALEGAEASGNRIHATVRRVAARISTALADADGGVSALQFAVVDFASGRRDAFDEALSEACDVAAITLEPVHVPALLIAPRGLAALLVERSYGGRIQPLGTATMRRPGLGEAREFARLAERFAAALAAGCDDRIPIAATRLGTIDAVDARDLLAAGEAVARITFAVTMSPLTTAHIVTLLLPLAALRTGSILQVALAPRDGAARSRWRDALSRRAGDIALPTRSVIARPLLSMQQLMALRPGDVIPIAMPRRVPLLVADRRVATGTIGERDGRVAFMIDQLEQEPAR